MKNGLFHFSASFSYLVVSFKDETFVSQERTESHTLMDILGNVGGLFGLFMGASLLSLVELLYYLSFRILFAKLRERKAIKQTDQYPEGVFPFLP